MAETKRPCVMGTGEEETFVRKLQYSLYTLLKMNFKISKAVHQVTFFYINRTTRLLLHSFRNI
jgi:hypothetical protein